MGVKEKASHCSDIWAGLGLKQERAYWAGECIRGLWEESLSQDRGRACIPGPGEVYLSQGRVLLSSMGTTLWVLLPASKHKARMASSFVLGSSCKLSRSTIPSTISSIYREDPKESQ